MLTTSKAIMHFYDKRGVNSLKTGNLAFDLFFDVIGKLVDINNLNSNFLTILTLSKIDSPTSTFA